MTRVSRERHLRYINRLTPILTVSYVLQCFLYLQWAPEGLASPVIIFLGAALACLVAGFLIFNQHHKIDFHAHHLEVRFDLLRFKQEILYRDIQWIEVSQSRHGFATLTLTAHDHQRLQLFYVDDPRGVKEFLDGKRRPSAA